MRAFCVPWRALWAPGGAICSPAFAGLRVLRMTSQYFQCLSVRGKPRYYASIRRVLRPAAAHFGRYRSARGRRFPQASCFPSRCHGAHLLSNTPSHVIGLTRVWRFSTACQGSRGRTCCASDNHRATGVASFPTKTRRHSGHTWPATSVDGTLLQLALKLAGGSDQHFQLLSMAFLQHPVARRRRQDVHVPEGLLDQRRQGSARMCRG